MALATSAIAAATAYLDGKYQLRRELKILWDIRRAERDLANRIDRGIVSPWYILEEVCAKVPRARAIWTRQRSWTFAQLREQAARYAQWMLDEGVRPGDLVAIYMLNGAEFMMLLFATYCIGASPSLINYNLEGKALTHCLRVCEAKLLIVDDDEGCRDRINASKREIEAAGARVFVLDSDARQQVSSRASTVPDESWRKSMTADMPLCLLYTSGTTGMPKGCPFTIARMYSSGPHLNPAYGMRPGKDCWYSPMPLYHGTGIILALNALFGGVGLAIPPKFSVRHFWSDIHDSASTGLVYVGETARYLLNAPPHALERDHIVRVAYGNGLRPDVWRRFQDRFNIPEIAEFFGSSEGVFLIAGWAKGEYLSGCVGHHGLLGRLLLRNVYIPVRIDHDTGDIWRDPETGFAERMPYDKGGEIIVAVETRDAFAGYWGNKQATDKRFAVDIFRKGDLFYRTGDALRRGPDGHWYFLDRLGDTFRWKSENVSTAEVASSLARQAGVSEANVYGVSVPGHEGRAGCAALLLDEASPFSLEDLLRIARADLPKYAVPLFLRIVNSPSHIHNHKQNKVGLRREGVDPNLVGTQEVKGREDSFFWLGTDDKGNEAYVPFRSSDWDRLVKGQVRL